MSMLWMCLFLAWGNAEIPWDDLVTARLTKQSGTLNPSYWMDRSKPVAARQAYLLTLGQIGNPADAGHLLQAFADLDVQAEAIFAYGELELAEVEPLVEWLPKVKAQHQHLIMEALSKHARKQDHARVIQLWESLPAKTQDQALFYLWRTKLDALSEKVIEGLTKATTPTLSGHVYYLFRSRSVVTGSLAVKLIDGYANDPQTLIYASRVLVEGEKAELLKRFENMTTHADWRIRNQALQGVQRLQGNSAAFAHKLLNDPNPNVQKTAVRALLASKSSDAEKALLAFAKTATPTLVQTMVANASEGQVAPFLPLVADWKNSKDSWKKWHGLRFEAKKQEDADLQALEKRVLALDSTQTVLSLNALNQLAPEKARALAPQLMSRKDPFVLNAVLNTISSEPLGEWAVPFEEIRNLVNREYRENIFQHSFIQGLKTWLPKQMAVAEYQQLTKHPDYLVRYNTVRGMDDATSSQWQQVFAQDWTTPYPKKARGLAADLFHADKVWKLKLKTTKGDVVIKLEPHLAPITCANIAYLSNSSYFVGLPLHRVVPNFVVQMGDGRGDGSGGPGYAIPCEVNPLRYERGSVGMALLSKDSGSSQFFICHSSQPHLDGGYTIFGSISEAGMALVDQMEEGDVITRAIIELETGPAAGLK